MSATYFLVIGRIEGDDEDTMSTYEITDPTDVNEVRRIFTEDMKYNYIEAASESGEEPDPDAEVIIDYVFVSDTPITECWNKWA